MCDSYEIVFGDKVCRSCLSYSEDMQSLNDPYSAEMCVADVFTCITSLKCSEDNDVLPTQICHECFGQLQSSYQFVLKSRESDKKLQLYLNKIHKTKETIVADDTRNISDHTITDYIKSVQSENVTHLTATTLLKTGHNMNDLTLSNRDLFTENEIKTEGYESNDNMYEHIYEPIITLKTPLLKGEIQKDLDQDLIKHEIDIDIKTEISNDNYKNSIAINNEPANEQDIGISSEIHLQSNQIANIITSDVNNEMENELNESTHNFISTNDRVHNQCKQTNIVTATEINKIPTANMLMASSDHGHVHVLPKTKRHLENQGETQDVCIESADRTFCKKSFSGKVNKARHRRTQIQTRMQKVYTCEVCNKSFNLKNSLVRHKRMHTGEKPYSCTACIKSFNQKGHLIEHMRTHTGEKPYSCTVCIKSFSRKYHLVEHTRTHTGEMPYSCEICNKSFHRNSQLTAHMLTHTGEKPYLCTVCNKSLCNKISLFQHMRTHAGEKPYSCTTCNRLFNLKAI